MSRYLLKIYRRTKDTAGELTERIEIEAPDNAQAEQIAVKGHVSKIDFKTGFAILEDGKEKSVTLWLTGFPKT